MTSSSFGKVSNGKTVTAALFLMSLCGYIVPLMLPALAPAIAHTYEVDLLIVGVVAGGQYLIAGIAAMMFAPFLLSMGQKQASISMLLVVSLLLGLTSAATTFSEFCLMVSLAAAAYGCLLVFALAGVVEWCTESERQRATAFVTSSLFFASVTGVPLALIVAQSPSANWRWGVAFVAGVALVAALVMAVTFRGVGESKKVKTQPLARQIPRLLTNRQLISFFTIVLLARFGTGAYMTFAPSYLMAVRGFPAEGFIWIFALSGIVAFWGSNYAGRVVTAGNANRLFVAATLIAAAMVVAIISAPVTQESVFTMILAISLVYSVSEAFRMTVLSVEAVAKSSIEDRRLFLGFFSFLMSAGYAIGAALGGLCLFEERSLKEGFALIVYGATTLWIASSMIMHFRALGNTHLEYRLQEK